MGFGCRGQCRGIVEEDLRAEPYRLLQDTLNTVGQVDTGLGVVPSSQFCNARPTQAQRTADDDLKLLFANEVNSVGSLLREKGREQGGAGMVVALEPLLVSSEPLLDDGRVGSQPRPSESVVLKALQKIADIRKVKGHDLMCA